ncbi:Aminopeptidase YwaD [bacterium HR33]|nr:Aminopeptidase YwaD [bacterium HR33]
MPGLRVKGRAAFTAATLWCVLASGCSVAAPGPGAGPGRAAYPREQRIPLAVIDTLELRAHTYFLAHDALAGRATGTPGGELAAIYIAAQCRRLGLQPAAGDYFQEVPLVEITFAGGTLRVRDSVSAREFVLSEDFVPDFMTGRSLDGLRGPAVYLNTPIDLEVLPPLEGAIAVTLGPVGGPSALSALEMRGAAAVIQAGVDRSSFTLYRSSRGETLLRHADDGIESSLLSRIPVFVAGAEVTAALLAGTPLALGRPMPDGPLGKYVELELRTAHKAVSARNVACLLPGREPELRDTAIAYTAHYDHLGYGPPDERGDSVYNGFSDNAAGVAMLLAIAKAMKEGPAPRHSFLFLFFTGEERGLLGSDYYVARPVWPLERTRAVINLDAGAPPGRPASWRLAGGEGNELGLLAVDVALEMGWSATTSAARPNSDYFPFHREGVPAIAVIPGPGPFQGLTTDSSNALRRRWDFYHRPGDEWSEEFPFAGLQRYASYAYLIGAALDRRDRP